MSKLAIIGSGATTVYLLKHLLDHENTWRSHIKTVAIFEKYSILGMGMPYNPETTDRYHIANIASEELPELFQTFADWLREQEETQLQHWGIEKSKISKSEVYSRLSLGNYLQSQYHLAVKKLRAIIEVEEHANCEVLDISYHADKEEVTLHLPEKKTYICREVVIATGHVWKETDNTQKGNYASPWPIFKLLPEIGQYHNCKIGTLGSSLSAFDVITSLAHRHGTFTTAADGRKTFQLAEGAEGFHITMHDANGWLPHLQYEQEEAMREIYRHVQRDELLGLIDKDGFLRLETYFDQVCRPALRIAFEKDEQQNMVNQLDEAGFGLMDFVKKMSRKHEYENAFEGLRHEMKAAKESVHKDKPMHWKEVLDDLMYALNFHGELLCAEDHLFLHKTVMPFLKNVIAAMPLPSGYTLLALYDAGCLDLAKGFAEIIEEEKDNIITVEVTDGEEKQQITYQLFINCSGQGSVDYENYPFQNLLDSGAVRKARALFADSSAVKTLEEGKEKLVFQENGQHYLTLGGIDLDAGFRIVDQEGKSNPHIYDIAFTHTAGIRPYSIGLQACSAISLILVDSLGKALKEKADFKGSLEEVSEIYEAEEKL